MPRGLTPQLAELKETIEGYARGYGLDFFETVFELVTYDELNMVAAYGGFPNRYPHWRWGMEYEQLSKGYEYGLSKIYELVINNDPTYAYLMESNAEVDQKLVMAHVYGHADFFKNNFYFQHTNRRMIDEMANHATRIRRWVDKIGIEKIEDFIDRALSLENLIDYHSPYIRRNPDPRRAEEEEKSNERVEGFRVGREYMRGFVNPTEFLDQQRRKVAEEKQRKKQFPERPQRDVLLFLLEHAPLEPWEFDILATLREEAYYFAPQGQTKIMNEGWASYWHSTIMTRQGLTSADIINYTPVAWPRAPIFLAEATGYWTTVQTLVAQAILLSVYVLGGIYMFVIKPRRERSSSARPGTGTIDPVGSVDRDPAPAQPVPAHSAAPTA